jgi:signal transduction histidine kinase
MPPGTTALAVPQGGWGLAPAGFDLPPAGGESDADPYRTIFDSIDQGCCIVQVQFDGRGRCSDYVFLEVNPAFERETGIRDAVGQSMRAIAPGHEEAWFEIYGRVARTGVAERFQHTADALGRHYDVYAFRLGEAQRCQVAILFTDISERLHHEAVARDAARRKDDFLAILAHELRNPLTPLLSGLQILQMTDCERATAQSLLPMLQRQVGQLVRLVDDLLDASRLSGGKVTLRPETVDIASVLDRAIETSQPLLDAAGHRLELQLPPVPLRVQADPLRLAQVFSNLLNNAAKYTDAGGHITLAVQAQGHEVAVSVQDNGVGIAAELLPHVFDLYTQAVPRDERSGGGIGIGLALVRDLLHMQGGRVQACSDGPGRGSRFTVYLPLSLPAQG